MALLFVVHWLGLGSLQRSALSRGKVLLTFTVYDCVCTNAHVIAGLSVVVS